MPRYGEGFLRRSPQQFLQIGTSLCRPFFSFAGGAKEKERREMVTVAGAAAVDCQECLKWLDSKKPNLIIYLYFSSDTEFTTAQNLELATGLEGSG
ncbi:unnamed protein product [Linum trigynum]|uniref:Uncharacterized protein n=1 Tax=Linum trigynum TaxID=586398 RepID=A0AAV2DCH7_9ROSI